MTNDELCMALMRADTEGDVIDILREAGYWEDSTAWRLLGDTDNNYSSIGNQQSEPVAALIEKIINGVDARLMNACWQAHTNPESPEAPKTIRSAVARFFEGKTEPSDSDGRISEWIDKKATAEGRLLTVSATGNMPSDGVPSISIADQGEGQEPDRFPETFMSLHRSNKLRIHFVQGKFNMGGTGALQFCSGEHKLQLIVSRRNPALVESSSGRARQWGFTVVRREWPKDGGRSSVFTYLAPVRERGDSLGGVLTFEADTWPIFPEADEQVRDAYHRRSEHGSLIKLYEYDWGTRSNIVYSGGGLLQRLDLGLPELALPVRVFECRPGYSGHRASFATNVMGLIARLQKDRNSNLEPEIPSGSIITLDGSQVKIRIFVFKPGKGKDYRTAKQGVVFAVNGQTHAAFSIDFFRRKAVGMSYLADSLLVLVDCSAIDGQMREDLFMNSRDRLRDTPLARRLEAELERLLRDEPTLKELRNRRRSDELSEKLADSKPLVNVLQDILKNSPTLAKLFLQGVKLSSPFPPNSGSKVGGTAGEFHGKTYPTYFRFKGLRDGEQLVRDAHLGSRVRIALETDAEDDYFMRDLDPGASRLLLVDDGGETEISAWSMRGPRSGLASAFIMQLPDEAVLDQILRFRLEITDPSRIDAFVNNLELRVCPPASETDRHPYGRSEHKNSGSGNSGGSSSLELPNIREVERADWEDKGFNELSALKIMNVGEQTPDTEVYDFFINVDNKYLRLFQKESKSDPKVIKAKFVYGSVLLGLALIQEGRISPAASEDASLPTEDIGVERLVEVVSRAVAPILLPLLESIGALDISETD
jgi:hypothetical protein